MRVWSIVAVLALAGCGAQPPANEDKPPEATLEEPLPVMGPERVILAFGDSLFAGYNLAEDEGYPEKLEATLRGRGINARVLDAGVSGDTSAAGLQRIGFVLDNAKAKPDLAIVELGGNDLLRGLSPAETRANLEGILRALAEREIPALIMGMRAPSNLGAEFRAQFDAIYPALAEQYGAQLVPGWLDDIAARPELVLPDRIHPNAEGVEFLVGQTVDDVLGALPEEGN